jgi:hypothetical protein
MSKRLQRKPENCLICQKKIKKTIAHIPVFNYFLNEMYEMPLESNICTHCLSIYDKNMNLVGVNKNFIMEYGEA